MRIISGLYKGKKILEPIDRETRPLKDLAKESIFNVINHSNKFKVDINNAVVLDLFSGVGSFGLECLSRGADKIVFVERNKDATNTLNANLKTLSLENKAEVLNENIKNFLNRKQLKKFDIFFMDPPFANNNFIEELKLIKQKKIYKKNHIVIIHRESKTSDNFDKILDLILIKKYGRSKIIFGKF